MGRRVRSVQATPKLSRCRLREEKDPAAPEGRAIWPEHGRRVAHEGGKPDAAASAQCRAESRAVWRSPPRAACGLAVDEAALSFIPAPAASLAPHSSRRSAVGADPSIAARLGPGPTGEPHIAVFGATAAILTRGIGRGRDNKECQ